jgi:hypothetical protein
MLMHLLSRMDSEPKQKPKPKTPRTKKPKEEPPKLAIEYGLFVLSFD